MGLSNYSFLLGIGVVLALVGPSHAFGAGNIVGVSQIEGKNWRHGDIEDTLLQLAIAAGGSKFSKLDVKRVYFGNWLRDYSQAIDVGGLKQLSADTIRILLWVLSFMTFGYATNEFEVTRDRLGCYRPEEHIDNPKNYADNEDARHYDDRLRGPVDEGKELRVDQDNGLKVYIASENAGCDTSAGLVRRLIEESIDLGRRFRRDKNKGDQYESLRKLGTALHCMEDFSAHSNYTELVLRELGVDVFVFVGSETEVDVRGKRVFPVVTGTFGMTDFLHSVVGEMGDKVAQSEIDGLESQLNQAAESGKTKDQFSALKVILDKVPWSMLSGGSAPDTAQGEELKRKSEAKANEQDSGSYQIGGMSVDDMKRMAEQTAQDIYPILEWHDKIMKAISKVVSVVPGLDELIEDVTGALTVFIFSLLAPYVKPIIVQARAELKSSSEGVLKSSEKEQYAVFDDNHSTDPTHSMLSKDHFSNILNPVAGQVASATVKFVVPLVVAAWEDDGKDVRQVTDEILQVFHHPALRDENRAGQRAMYETVRDWWNNKDESEKRDYQDRLSRDGVRNGKNHRGEGAEGGHYHNQKTEGQVNAESTIVGLAGGLMNMVLGGKKGPAATTQDVSNAQNVFQNRQDNRQESSSYGQQESTSYGRQESSSNYGRQESSSNYGRQESASNYGRQESSNLGRQDNSGYGRQESSSYGRQDNSEYGRQESSNYGRQQSRNDREDSSYGRQSEYSQQSSYGRDDGNSYGREQSGYNRNEGRRQEEETSYGRESSGRGENQSYYGGESGSRRQESSGYGDNNYGRQESSQYGDNAYGRQQSSQYGDNSYGRRSDNNQDEDFGYGQEERSQGRRHHRNDD